MKNLKSKAAAVAILGLFIGPFVALAAPGDWQVTYRNTDDTEYVPFGVQTRATSSPAVLGGRIDADEAAWYYFGTEFTITNQSNAPYTGNKYLLNVTDLPISSVTGLTSALSAKADASTESSDVASLQSQINGISPTQADWNQSSTTAKDYIKNKPSIVGQAQADWNEASTTKSSFIVNKPSLNFDVLGQATSSAATAQAYAIQRSNHTGTQPASTITGLAAVATTSSYTDLTNKPNIGVAYEGTTLRTGSFPIFKLATVSSGVAVVNFTNDGTSGGTALCTNGVIQDSVNVIFNDSGSSFQQSWAFSNSNKTLTVTANKFTTANILSGILGQAAANASVAKITVWCY